MSHVRKLDMRFEIADLISGIDHILGMTDWHPSHNQIGLTQSLGPTVEDSWYDATGSLAYAWGDDPFDADGELKKNSIIRNERDFCHMVPGIKGTIFERVINDISDRYALGRVRLMRLRPKACMSWHTDSEQRLHIPIVTHDGAFLVIDGEAVHLPADGCCYMANTTLPHTAFNAGLKPRIHLVACITDATV